MSLIRVKKTEDTGALRTSTRQHLTPVCPPSTGVRQLGPGRFTSLPHICNCLQATRRENLETRHQTSEASAAVMSSLLQLWLRNLYSFRSP